MKDIFLCSLAFSMTVSMGSNLVDLTSKPRKSLLSEDFDSFDLRMCRNDLGLDAIKLKSNESNRYFGKCGPIPIPNLVLPRPVFEF